MIIPEGNVDDLMPPEEVVEAVRDGKFHIWAVKTVEEGIETLSGMPAGTPDEEGNYPEGTLFHLVQRRLSELREKLKAEEEEEG